jgi:hypothetical protein
VHNTEEKISHNDGWQWGWGSSFIVFRRCLLVSSRADLTFPWVDLLRHVLFSFHVVILFSLLPLVETYHLGALFRLIRKIHTSGWCHLLNPTSVHVDAHPVGHVSTARGLLNPTRDGQSLEESLAKSCKGHGVGRRSCNHHGLGKSFHDNLNEWLISSSNLHGMTYLTP